MWPMIYLCGVLNGELDCVKIQAEEPAMSALACSIALQHPWPTIFQFMIDHPQYSQYRLTYGECTSEKIGQKQGQET